MYLFRFNPTEIDISDRMIRRFSNEYKDFFIEYILYQRDHSRYFDKYKKRKYFLKYTDKSFNIRKAEQTKLVKTYDILRSYISEKHIVNIILDYKYDFEYIDFLYTVI